MTRVPVWLAPTITSSTMPTLDGTIVPGFPAGPETDALGHWVFGGSAASLIAINDDAVALTPVSTAPTYSTSSMTISSAGRHGLNTPWKDTDYSSFTHAVVVKYEEQTESKVVWGTATPTSGDGGAQGFIANDAATGNDVSFLSRGSASQLRVEAQGYFTGVSVDQFMIMIWSRSDAHGLSMYCHGSARRGGPADYVADNAPVSFVPSTDEKFFSLGNVSYTGAGWTGGLTFAEYIFFGERLTQAEMIALAGRMYSRQYYRPSPVDLAV